MKGTEIPKGSYKLRVVRHNREPNAVNSYMIANSLGAIYGGNIQMYFFEGEAGRNAYPTRFKSRASGERWLKNNPAYVEQIQTVCKEALRA